MLNQIIAWSLQHRLFVLLVAAALLVYGGFAVLAVPIDVFPDLTAPTVTVLTESGSHQIEAKIEGTPLGVVGRLTAKSITRLEDAGSETKVTYSVESTLAGKLGSTKRTIERRLHIIRKTWEM